jgi:hypothetical protein
METVGNFPDLASAKLAQSILKARGIASLIPDEYMAGVDWQLGTALQGIRLQVGPADVELARWLLAQTSPAPDVDAAAELEDRDEDEVCPRCQSTLVGPPPWKRQLKVATFFFPPFLLLWPLLAFASGNRTCLACGLSWDRPRGGSSDPGPDTRHDEPE